MMADSSSCFFCATLRARRDARKDKSRRETSLESKRRRTHDERYRNETSLPTKRGTSDERRSMGTDFNQLRRVIRDKSKIRRAILFERATRDATRLCGTPTCDFFPSRRAMRSWRRAPLRAPLRCQMRNATATPSRVGLMLVRNPRCERSRFVNSITPRVAAEPSFCDSSTRPDQSTLSVMKRPPGRRCW